MENKVRFVYVPSPYTLPPAIDMDSAAIYFGESEQQLWAQRHLIANYSDDTEITNDIKRWISATYEVKSAEVESATGSYLQAIVDARIDESGKLILTSGSIAISLSVGPDVSGQSQSVTADDPRFQVLSGIQADGTTILPVKSEVTLEGFASSSYVDSQIEGALSGLSGAMHFIGVSSTPIHDGEASLPTIDGEQVVPQSGDVVIFEDAEFVWNGNVWNELGTSSSFALKTTRIIADAGLSGGGQLSSDVAIQHADARDYDFSEIRQEFDTDGSASDLDRIGPNGNVRISLVDKIGVDEFGHVTSVIYKNITTYLVQLAKYIAESEVHKATEGVVDEAVLRAKRYTDEVVENLIIEGGDVRWAEEDGSDSSSSSDSNDDVDP